MLSEHTVTHTVWVGSRTEMGQRSPRKQMLVVVDAVTSLFLAAGSTADKAPASAAANPHPERRCARTHRVLVTVAWTLPPVIILLASIDTMNSSGALAYAPVG
jgi:hypothetical protein